MSKLPEQKFDFLRVYIERMLADNGLDKLSPTTRAQYVPQFRAEAELRLGEAIMPFLQQKNLDDLDKLLMNKKTTPDDVQKFWQDTVPNFDQIVARTLENYTKDVQEILAKIRAK